MNKNAPLLLVRVEFIPHTYFQFFIILTHFFTLFHGIEKVMKGVTKSLHRN